MKLIALSLSLVLATACGKTATSDLQHDDHTTTVIPVGDLDAIFDLYQNAVVSGDTHAIADQIALMDSLAGVPLDKLFQGIGLTPGFGEHTITFMPTDPTLPANELLVNQLINQGLAMYHNFHYIDAVRSFQEAADLDSNSAYARIFGAIAYINFGNELNAFVFAAKNLAEASRLPLTSEQRAWLLFATGHIFSDQYPVPLRTLYNQLQVATNNAIETVALGGWLSGMASEKNYEDLLKTSPTRHVGVVHYLTHMNERPNAYDKAKQYGAELASLSPMGGHAQHMYGHVLPMFGEFEEAKIYFLKADKIHKDWAAANNYELDYDWHFSHNNHLLGVVHLALDEIPETVSLLSLGCNADDRACDGLAKVGVMKLDQSIVDQAWNIAKTHYSPAEQPAYKAFYDKYAAEIDFLKGGSTDANALLNLANQFRDPIAFAIALMETVQPGTEEYNFITNTITGQFAGGGFDSWANGYPNMVRLKLGAERSKRAEFLTLINAQLSIIIK